ncbi:TPA: 3-oxo-5-alpha-steroid 4-dehydrogenase 2, variant 2 [Trebouxia sp. C0006]
MTQEMWSCFIPLTLFFCNSGMGHKLPLLFLVGHYAYRSFVFPFWLQQPKPTPLHVWVAACIFVVYNGILQGTQLVFCRHVQVTPAQTVFGAIMWGFGFAVDVQSDLILQNLRRRNPQQGYQIPNGGLYKLVSCPNYLGETIEWTGYAITTNSLAGFAFAFYTFANLAARARHHHKWYKERFADYPANRKAYVPYLW